MVPEACWFTGEGLRLADDPTAEALKSLARNRVMAVRLGEVAFTAQVTLAAIPATSPNSSSWPMITYVSPT